MWDGYQLERLRIEADIVSDEHAGFAFELGPSTGTLRGRHFVGSQLFAIRIEVPSGYPDQMPKVYVESPNPLRAFGGSLLNDRGPSHDYHILSPGPLGETQICHFPSTSWDATKTIHLVILKAKLWLHGYEWHKSTGHPICEFFSD